MCYIGLDAGTSGIKALAFDEEGRILAAACQDYPLITPRDGWRSEERRVGKECRL